jgi:putative ABC transport system permease protein
VTPSIFGIPTLTLAEWMGAGVGAVLLVLLLLAAWNRVLLKMALRNIPRRRAQTVLILFGLMLATLIITSSLAVGDTLTYSLVSIQMPQLGGVDEAFTRHADSSPQGASTSETDFFSSAQTADVIARSKLDPNIASAVGVIVAPGSMVDLTSDQASSKNVAVFGVPADFTSVWGTLLSRSGTSLDVSSLGTNDVFVGNQLADTLNAHVGDTLKLFVDGHLTQVTVRGVLNTEINPSIAAHGPIVNSVVMPIETMGTIEQHQGGSNLILLHNYGAGGLDDLGPGGATGTEITQRLRSAFTDQQAAAEMFAYLNTPAIKAQIKKIHNDASFLDPTQDLSRRLLAALDQPAVTNEFKALVGDQFVLQFVANAVTLSVPQSSPAAVRAAQDEFRQRVASLQVDSNAAAELKALLAQPDVQVPLQQLAASLPADDPTRATIISLFAEVARADLSPKFRATVSNPSLQQAFARAIAVIAPIELAQFNDIAGRLDLYQYSAYKADAVTFGLVGGTFISGALLGVSFFSIAVGVLLIFLIFVMLAAERRAEMGMSRAVGLKRRHLTQMFLFEGTAYTLAASVIGVVLGVLVGMLMIQVLSSIFTGFYKGLALQYHVEWTTLVVSVCLGILLTFIVVAFSAYRVSRLNIVAAIRDLDESEHRGEGMLRLFTAPFRVVWAGLKQLRHGHPLVFLNRITLGFLGAIRTFWWALFKRGPMTIALGVLLIELSLSSHGEIVYTAGVSLVIVGSGLLLRWILTTAHVRPLLAGRAGFTLAAIGLLVYWARPFGKVEELLHITDAVKYKELLGGPEVFALTALMVLLGAIWLVMYNSDLLIRGVMFFTGRIGAVAPITRTSMAYPMASKFRTGMAVAMFAIVTFMIVYMSVFKDVLLQNFGDADAGTGHWKIVAGSPDSNFQTTDKTVFPADAASLVRADPVVSKEVRGVGWENYGLTVNMHQVRADGTVNNRVQGQFEGSQLHAVDDGYLNTTGYAIQPRAAGYASDRDVWNAVRDNKGYAVIDAGNLDSFGGNPAIISGIKSTDASFQPFQVQVTTPNISSSTPWTLTVIGFMTRPFWSGVYVSLQTTMDSGFFAAPGAAPTTPSSNGPQSTALSNLRPLTPTGYYFALNPGVDPKVARLDLGRMLVQDQLEPVIVADQLAQQLSTFLTLINLVTGFLALGLIVGIAGLGVISTRAVVERWQQIGMLRALGYRRSLVQRSFLMESSLIAILGLVIGALVGVLESYRFFVVDKTFGTVDFHVPLPEIGLILLAAYVATLLTTYLPARAASRVAPAEALRYE